MYTGSVDWAQGLSAPPLRVTHPKQPTVQGATVLTERTGLSIAMGEASYSFIQDTTLPQCYSLPKEQNVIFAASVFKLVFGFHGDSQG